MARVIPEKKSFSAIYYKCRQEGKNKLCSDAAAAEKVSLTNSVLNAAMQNKIKLKWIEVV